MLKLFKMASVLACVAALAAPGAVQAKRAECTSMCHLFDAYALAQVCPNFTLTPEYYADLKSLFAGERATPRFKADSMTGVSERIAKAVNVCAPSCLKLEIKDGTACQYLKPRPTVADAD